MQKQSTWSDVLNELPKVGCMNHGQGYRQQTLYTIVKADYWLQWPALQPGMRP